MSALASRVALLQRWIGVTPDDGIFGHQTLSKLEDKLGITSYRDSQQTTKGELRTTSSWPADTTSALIRYYGKPGPSNLVKITFPYPMRLAWDLSQKATSSRCHKKVKDSLERALEMILEHYNGIDGVREARMDRFGGIYNFRKMRGGSSYSRHSWGIAIDLDPDQNGLHVRRPRATMPEAVVRIFEAVGAKSGGRAWGRDWMHYQFTQ